jgi:hypothetical protein
MRFFSDPDVSVTSLCAIVFENTSTCDPDTVLISPFTTAKSIAYIYVYNIYIYHISHKNEKIHEITIRITF